MSVTSSGLPGVMKVDIFRSHYKVRESRTLFRHGGLYYKKRSYLVHLMLHHW